MKNEKLEQILKEFKAELLNDKEVTGIAAVAEEDGMKIKYYGGGTAEGLGMLLAYVLDKLAEEFGDEVSDAFYENYFGGTAEGLGLLLAYVLDKLAEEFGDKVSDAFYETLEEIEWRRRKQ